MSDDPFAAIAEPAQPQGDPFAAIAEKPDAPPSTPSLRDRLTEIQPHQPIHSLRDAGREAVRGVGNIGAGGLGLLLRPVDTLKGIAKTIGDPSGAADELSFALQEHPAETVEAGIGQAGAAEVGAGVVRGVGKVLPKVNNPFTRAITDTTPRETVTAVREASEGNAAKAAEHQTATQDALHETEGRELKHQDAVKNAADEAEKAKRQTVRKHMEERSKAIADRQAAEAKLKGEQAKQGKIAPTTAKLKDAWSNLRAKIETAREAALKTGNEKYSAVNEELSHLPADMESVHGLYQDAANAMGETQAMPSLIQRLGKSIQKGEELTYKDEQALYSELGKELSKGTLNGPTYHAFDILHEGVGKDMQRIADSKSMGPQLTDARNYWRRMKQTFGKPLAMRDAATKTLKGSASGLAGEEATANQLRMLGSFDESIPQQYNHVSNIEKGASSLPEPTSDRTLAAKAKAPAIPPRKPVLPKVEPPPAAPERVAPPDRPQETTFSPQTMADLKKQNLLKATDQLRHSKSPLVSAVAGYGTIKALLMRNLATAGLDITARILYGAAKPTLANILENPRVVTELTKFTAKDAAAIAKLPPEARASFVNDMSPVVQGAKAKGVRVSPALLGVIAPSQPARKGVAAALSGGSGRDPFMAASSPKGLVEKGNLPIWNRPSIDNGDGTHSSEYSTSFTDDNGREVLVPTVVNGKFLTPDGKKPQEGSAAEKAMFKSAWQHYLKTGENLGKFDNPDDADAYAGVLHNRGQ